ncbi:MAG: hypothetical protein JWM35_2511 [Verrucomicrobia bacterium]|nr:hypothetical protein [Verrucomicrobiota bacterium]
MPRTSGSPSGWIRPGARVGGAAQLRSLLALLSPAERRVMEQIKRGFSTKEIAAALNKSPATVKAQIASILKKLNAPSRCRLIAWLHESAGTGDAR